MFSFYGKGYITLPKVLAPLKWPGLTTLVIYNTAKSIGTPSNERFDYFSNLHEC